MCNFDWYLANLPQITALARSISPNLVDELIGIALDIYISNTIPPTMSSLKYTFMKHRNNYYKLPTIQSTALKDDILDYNIGDDLQPTVPSGITGSIYRMRVLEGLTFKYISRLTATPESTVRRIFWKVFYDMRKRHNQ